MNRNCNICNEVYHAEARYVNRGQGLTCSRGCGVEWAVKKRKENSPEKKPNAICAWCQGPIWKRPSQLAKATKVFCNKEHADLAYSAGIVITGPNKSERISKRCLHCDGKLSGTRGYLHLKCSKPYKISQWLAGDNESTLKHSRTTGLPTDTKAFVKQHLLETRGDKCEECSFNKYGPYGSIIQMDHINGNCFDNRPENLKLLCPNCHAMTKTYGSRNKGSGRAHRRKG